MEAQLIDVGVLARQWKMVVFRGVAAILFGLISLSAPHASLFALVLVFGAYAFLDGVLAIASAFQSGGAGKPYRALLLEGIAGIVAGVAAALWPGITALALTFVIAAWAIVTGVLEIAAAVRLRKAISGEWLLALTGVLSLAIGALLVLFPRAGMFALVLWIGAYAVVFGLVLIALGLRLRSRLTRGATLSQVRAS